MSQEEHDMKLRNASESVGWLNSEGPLTRAPGAGHDADTARDAEVVSLRQALAQRDTEIEDWKANRMGDHTGHMFRCAKVNGVWVCATGCAQAAELQVLRVALEQAHALNRDYCEAAIHVNDTLAAAEQVRGTVGHGTHVDRIAALALPTEEEYIVVELRVIEHVLAHWCTQGGRAQFGELGSPHNVDELVSAILACVRKGLALGGRGADA